MSRYQTPLRDAPPANETARERDERMDERYVALDRTALCCEGMGILGVVSAYRNEFADEFLCWWSAQSPRDSLEVALASWEVMRFGALLFGSAHRMLLFHVKERAFGPRRRDRQPRLTPGLSGEQRRDRMLTALDAVAQSKAMPRVSTSMSDLA